MTTKPRNDPRKITPEAMQIITCPSAQGCHGALIYNVERSRWELTDNVTIGQAHAAHDGDMDNAREAAIREGIHPDGIALDDFDELLND